MRIYTTVELPANITEKFPKSVGIERFTQHATRKTGYRYGYELHLSGSNSRNANGKGYKAALWDEWGQVLAAIFEHDSQAMTRDYKDALNFHMKTNGRFTEPLETYCNHKWTFGGVGILDCTKCDVSFIRY